YQTSFQIKEAWQTSVSELTEDLQILKQNPLKIKDTDFLGRIFSHSLESGIWLGKTTGRHLLSFFNLPQYKPLIRQSRKHKEIIQAIIAGENVAYEGREIFNAVFEELHHHSIDSTYTTKLKFPKLKSTVVLIPGIFNEMYRTPPFERGVANTARLYDLKYFCCRTGGRKSPSENAEFIAEALFEYIDKHPQEQLWLVAYSKGAIDTLHFINNNPKFAEKHIIGLSTIAAPLRGSKRSDHFLFDLLIPNFLVNNSLLARTLNLEELRSIHEGIKSLSEKHQADWFKKNFHRFPNIFYTSIAFGQKWYRSHIWMLMAKMLFQSKTDNDGVVDAENARFPEYIPSLDLGKINAHHLVGCRYSSFNQEAFFQAYIITLNYLGLLK
ncbi:MAG: hypothetical protein ACOCUH_02245, partial [Bacteriovoracia bacterium]